MSNNKQSSSVDWLLDNLHLQHSTKWAEIIEQAKEMHKEECINLLNTHNDIFDTSEYHYNKTFNTKEK